MSQPHSTRGSRSAVVAVVLLSLALGGVLLAGLLAGLLGHHPEDDHRVVPRFWAIGMIPFVILLLAIAVLPLIPRLAGWWHSNLNRLLLSLSLAVATCLFLVLTIGLEPTGVAVEHAMLGEYIPFIVLLFSLFVITGGIAVHGDLPATPAMNTTFLLIGTLSASVLGTTGASMLLIRPLLQTNCERKHKTHTVIFFIFLVSNIGGTLLPVGDPPLFLGYLRGVPFLWTLTLWGEWLLASVVLLVIYFIYDSVMYRRESPEDIRDDLTRIIPERVEGSLNFLWLLGVLCSVAFITPGRPMIGTSFVPPHFLREGCMIGFTLLSLLLTPRQARIRNEFNFHAINEVAALFIGIFITMQVPLMVLAVHGRALGLSEPWHFFWATGILSSLLDNAPTYQVFFETALTMTDPSAVRPVALLGTDQFIDRGLLTGVNLGAVFMGACTYIGNGPNFMVKSIADQAGIRMPGFFGYMLYSGAILLPLFVVITLVFLI